LAYPVNIPERAVQRFRTGYRYSQKSQFEDAEKAFSEAIEEAPNWADAYYNRAIVNEALVDYDQAAKDLRSYLSLKTDATDEALVREKIAVLDLAEADRDTDWNLLYTVLVVAPLSFLYIMTAGQP
jgi:tetratricopeptide (TPR) repeat protein